MITRLKKEFVGRLSLGSSLLICLFFWFGLSALPSSKFYIPSPGRVIEELVRKDDVLLRHFGNTFLSAALGFGLGLIIAVTSSLISLYWERLRKLFSLSSLILYSVPLIAAAPILALIFGSGNSGIALGCLGAFLPIFTAGVNLSEQVSKNIFDLSIGYGATKKDVNKIIRMPLMLRGWIIGAQSGWIWAVLGALIGDFTGKSWGLGTFLVSSLVQGEPSKVWAIVILCLTMAVVGLGIIKGIGKRVILDSSFDPIPSALLGKRVSKKSLINSNSINIMLILVVWQISVWIANIPGGVFAGPIDLVELSLEIFHGESIFTPRMIFDAFCGTWSISLLGVIMALVLAFACAVFQHLSPVFSRPIIAVVQITQVTPIVAFIPLIAFYLGRESASTITIVILSTIYPAYLIFLRSFEQVSKNAIEIAKGFGANNFSVFINIRLPNSLVMSFVALRLAIGRAFLGSITAEYLLSGKGLGGIIGQSRAFLDFRLVWLICLLIVIATLLTDQILKIINRSLLRSSRHFTPISQSNY